MIPTHCLSCTSLSTTMDSPMNHTLTCLVNLEQVVNEMNMMCPVMKTHLKNNGTTLLSALLLLCRVRQRGRRRHRALTSQRQRRWAGPGSQTHASSGRNGATRDPSRSDAVWSQPTAGCPRFIIYSVLLLREASYSDELYLWILEQTLSNPALFLLFLQPNPIPKPHANIFRVSCL